VRPACSFLNQLCAGGIKQQIPLYTAFTIDEIVAAAAEGERAPAFRCAGMGERLPNEENSGSSPTTARSIPACARPITARKPMTPRN